MGRKKKQQAKRTPPRKRGAPLKAIDPTQVRALAAIACTDEEIATILHTSHDTLTRRFRAELDEGRANMRMSLRRVQYQLAIAGNPSLLIWLGKNLLGQKDRQEIETRQLTETRVAGKTREQWRQELLERLQSRTGPAHRNGDQPVAERVGQLDAAPG